MSGSGLMRSTRHVLRTLKMYSTDTPELGLHVFFEGRREEWVVIC